MIDRNDPYFWADWFETILKGTGETFYTVGVSLLFTVLFGLAAGVLLVTTESGGLLSRPFGSRALGLVLNRVLDLLVNIGRSIPFIILLIGYSAMVGAVGGGGLGDVAFHYGYQRYSPEYMFGIVILLILLVQIFQSPGNFAARRLSHR